MEVVGEVKKPKKGDIGDEDVDIALLLALRPLMSLIFVSSKRRSPTDLCMRFLKRKKGRLVPVDLLRGQKIDRVDVSLQPEELEVMDNVLSAKYEEAREEEKLRSQREDFSDMVAALALAYNEALTSERLTTARGGIIQSVFLGSMRKRLEELLSSSEGLKNDLCNYLNVGGWPMFESCGERSSVILPWYLQWFGVPAPCIIKTTIEKIKSKPALISVPLLQSLFPSTHVAAIFEMNKILSSQGIG